MSINFIGIGVVICLTSTVCKVLYISVILHFFCTFDTFRVSSSQNKIRSDFVIIIYKLAAGSLSPLPASKVTLLVSVFQPVMGLDDILTLWPVALSQSSNI